MGYLDKLDKYKKITAKFWETEKNLNKIEKQKQNYDEFINLIKSAKFGDLPKIEKQRSEKLESIQTETEKNKAEAEKIKELTDKPIECNYVDYM